MSSAKIVVVDYKMGNLNSIVKTLSKLRAEVVVTNMPNDILHASKIILPGVGHFGLAVYQLRQMNLWDNINKAVLEQGIPILGICLGMQLMARFSEEGNAEGFGWFNATVKRFDNMQGLKVPHMGWNTIELMGESNLLTSELNQKEFYFAHSYHWDITEPNDVKAITQYGYSFASAVEKDHIFGVQFHPEKSHEWGKLIFSNFLQL